MSVIARAGAVRDIRAWHLIERNLFVYRRT